MTASRKGVLSGKTITLESEVPPLEGMKVRVLIEPAEESDHSLSPQDQARLWQDWVARGPQGPIELEEDHPTETP
jgi:hypothetical protein